MKINPDFYIKNYRGPSDNYHRAMARFDNILEAKLGVAKSLGGYSAINDQDSSFSGVENKYQNPIFDRSEVNSEINQNDISSYYLDNIMNAAKDSVKSEISNNLVPMAPKGLVDPNDIRKKSNATISDLDKILKDSKIKGTGKYFKNAEDIYGVNAYVLIAIAKLESQWGESQIARDKNNLFGFRAYDRAPYESAKSYESYKDSIYDVARYLSKNYLRPGATYFNGYSLEAVNKKYCTDFSWAGKLRNILNRIAK